jgi:hypothetical protein
MALDDFLTLFIRDEINTWMPHLKQQLSSPSPPSPQQVWELQRKYITENVAKVHERAKVLACSRERAEVRFGFFLLYFFFGPAMQGLSSLKADSLCSLLQDTGSGEGSHGSVMQEVIEVMNRNTNVVQLAKMDPIWHPWL